MITYEEYAEIRDKKNLTDGKIAKMCGFGRSTFSDWKSGRSVPKMDKMQKIAEALNMDYFAFVGPVGKLSAYNPNNPLLIETTGTITISDERMQRALKLYEAYSKAIPEIQNAVENLLKPE